MVKFTFPFCSLPLIALTILNITAARVENTVSEHWSLSWAATTDDQLFYIR